MLRRLLTEATTTGCDVTSKERLKDVSEYRQTMLKAFGVKGLYNIRIQSYCLLAHDDIQGSSNRKLKREGARSSEMLAHLDKTTRRHKSEDHNRNTYHAILQKYKGKSTVEVPSSVIIMYNNLFVTS